MVHSKQPSFLFLECDGPKGRTSEGHRRAKNRHAQLASTDVRTPHRLAIAPAPVQLRFRLRPASAYTVELPAIRRDGTPTSAKSGFVDCERCGQRLLLGGTAPSSPGTTTRKDIGLQVLCGRCSRWQHKSPACLTFAASPYTGPPLNADEVRAMGYFRTYAALDLSGYLPGHFWDQLVLQYTHTEPLARQAAVAVGNAHLDHCMSMPASPNTLLAYSAALKHLRRYIGSGHAPSSELVLSCCILLFALSRILGDEEAAMAHQRNGMAILLHVLRTKRSTNDSLGFMAGDGGDTLHQLAVMFIQLDIEATMQNLDRGPVLTAEMVAETDRLEQWTPSMRTLSPHAAMGTWMCIAHDMWRFIFMHSQYRRTPIAEVPASIVRERTVLQARIKAWRLTTKDYIKNNAAIETATQSQHTDRPLEAAHIVDALCALIIEAHHFSCKRFIAESLRDDNKPRPFDKNPGSLMRTAETVIKLRQRYHQTCNLHIKKTFSTHVGIVEALLLLAHRTSFPAIRSQAQHLIRQFQEVQHGLTGLAAFFAGYGAPPSDFILIHEAPGH